MDLKRRALIAGLGGAAGTAVWPYAARAQRGARMPTVGLILQGTPESDGRWIAAFAKRISELGWIDGRTVALVYRWAAGQAERYPELAAELVRLHADVIVTSASGTVAAVKQAAPDRPIVCTAIPTGSPLIASMAHPGGWVTGILQMGPELGGKRLALLRRIVPALRHLAILGLAGGANTVTETALVTAAAQGLKIEVTSLAVRRADDLAPAIAAVKGRADALYVIPDPFVTVNQVRINTLALETRLPTMHGLPDYVASGGLMSYGLDFEDLFRRSADDVDKLLRGARASDLPVQQPSKFDLVINLKTAKALGLTIPSALIFTADEVID